MGASSSAARDEPSRLAPRSVMFVLTHSNAGGAQELWANLADGFQVRGAQVRLVALFPSEGPVQIASPSMPLLHVRPRKPRTILEIISLVLAIARMVRTDRPDVIFTALPAANVLVPLAVVLAGGHSRVITSHHSPAETHSRLLNLLDGVTSSLRVVASVISVSSTVNQSHDHKPNAYKAKRQTVMNALPADIEKDLAKLRQGRHKRARGRLVVATGRLAEQKNYPVLIRALAHMPNVRLHIIGTGPDEASLKAMANMLGVSDRVDFLGFHPRHMALALLAEGDVFAQPSLFEGHSLALVEAARLGLPLVVSDVPVQVEGVTAPSGEKCGLVVGVHDDRALAEAIMSLLDDPERNADYAARSERLGDTATWESMLEAYDRLAGEAVAKRRRAG